MAQPRTNYHVSPRKDRDGVLQAWTVKKEGARQASRVFDKDDGHTKQDAVDYAKSKAKKNKPSEVKVKDRNGKIKERVTYEDDPMPPKG